MASSRRGRPSAWDANAVLHLIDAYLDYCAEHRVVARVEEFARRLNIDRSHLRRVFLATLGSTPTDILRELQFRRVKHLLTASDSTVEEVARLAGFGSRRSLQRAFQVRCAMSLSAYRRLYATK